MLDIIKSSTEISNVFAQGKRYNAPFLTILVYENDEQHGLKGRVAFVAGKKNGNAVWRNRAKRRMRALCRDLGGSWPGYDVVFVARRQTTEVSYDALHAAGEKLLARARVQR